jgi:hypothetical protein
VSRPSLLAIGQRRRIGRGDEEVHLAVVELGVQGLLIEQLRGLGFDKDPRTAAIDEGITGLRPRLRWSSISAAAPIIRPRRKTVNAAVFSSALVIRPD